MLPIDLETEVKVYLPIIFEILGERKIKAKQWLTINENYKREIETRTSNYYEKQIKLYEVNLYDLFDMKRKGNRKAYVFLDMVKRTLEELCDTMPIDDRMKLRDTIYSMLVHFDHKHRNYIGELLVLNNAVKHQHYSLVKIESPITKTTSADFLLKNLNNGKLELVEIVNIHVDEDQEHLKDFITGKLQAKYLAKSKGQADHKKFFVVPVIWSPVSILRQIEKMYDEGDGINLPFTLPPCAFVSFDERDDPSKFFVKFGTVTTMFKGLNIADS